MSFPKARGRAFRLIRAAGAAGWLALALLPVVAMFAAAPLPVAAQDAGASDQDKVVSATDPAWVRLAARAEKVLDDRNASDAALEQLRADLVKWRADFQTAQTDNETRVTTLKAQIAALGQPPESGEPPEITSRREQLVQDLSRLEAPRIAAEEAYSRADAMIREIDKLIRERQASALLERDPAPLNPANWPGALSELEGTLSAIVSETGDAWTSGAQRSKAWNNLPLVLVLLVAAALLLLRGPGWLSRMGERVAARLRPELDELLAFIVSLLRTVAVFFGFLAIQMAAEATSLAGYRASTLISHIGAFGLIVALSIWLGGRVFPRRQPDPPVLDLTPERRAEGRFVTLLLGLSLWAASMAFDLADAESYQAATRAVLLFPAIVLAGVGLFRVGQLVAHTVVPDAAEAEAEQPQPAFRRRLDRLVGHTMMAIGVIGPLAAALGYTAAARHLVFPALISVGLLALLIQIQELFKQLYRLVTHQTPDQLGEALIPVLFGLLLGLLSLPLFALIWGARVADLYEVWLRFRDGFSLGDTRISPGMFVTFVLVFAIGYGLTRLVQGTLRSTVLPKTKIDTGVQTAMISGIGYLGIFLAALLAITSTGVSLTSLAVVFGALSVGIGFGLQNIVQNFVSGIIMLVERPVAVGDWVEVGGHQGIVKAISVRSTRIETFDKSMVIVPNADFISGAVTNWTRGSLAGRIVISIGVAYGTDTRKVETILREIVEAHPLVTLDPAPNISFEDFGADALTFVIRAVLRNINFGLSTRSELRHQIAARFAEEGIEIPFGQRDIWLRNPEKIAEALRPAPPKPAGGRKAAAKRQTSPSKVGPEDVATNPADGTDEGVDDDK